jgi:hypothetical protein
MFSIQIVDDIRGRRAWHIVNEVSNRVAATTIVNEAIESFSSSSDSIGVSSSSDTETGTLSVESLFFVV